MGWSITIAAISIVCGLSLFGYLPNSNDVCLEIFASQLTACPVPTDCLVLEHHKLLGKLNGNGNGIDFASVLLLQTRLDMTADELLEYYSSFNFRPAKHSMYKVDIIVEAVEEESFRNEYIEHISLSFESKMNHDEYNYYAVRIFDGPYNTGLDLRGN